MHVRHSAEFCSLCGGERDGEGWCANYCMDGDEPVDTRRDDDHQPAKESQA